jgi:hypothetical protein
MEPEPRPAMEQHGPSNVPPKYLERGITMRISKRSSPCRRPKAETAFDALVEFVCSKCEVESDSQAAKLLGLHPPNVVSYRRSAPVRPSTWQTLFGRVWSLGVKEGRKEVTSRLLDAVEVARGARTQRQAAKAFGVKQPAVAHWRSGRGNPTRRQISRLLDYVVIRPIAEFRPVSPQWRGARWALCAGQEKGEQAELKGLLSGKKGLYILYDSMGSALYVGQSQKDLLFEIGQRLGKNSRGQLREYGMKKRLRQMGAATRFLSVYEVEGKRVVDRLEALLIRSMANDLQNDHMEAL